MDIQTTTAAATAASTAQTSVEDDKATLTSDYETFLQMLTVQMTNQDPLNPVDSSDYAVQLATFSSVEQQVLTNELLTDLASKINSTGLADLGGWIDREVRSDAPAYFDGEPITVSTEFPFDTTSATLSVVNDQGSVVRSLNLDLTKDTFDWPGTDAAGNELAHGSYTFLVTSYSGEDIISDDYAMSYSPIEEARLTDAGSILVLKGGAQVSTSDVTAVRN